jgi:hypothetical protein
MFRPLFAFASALSLLLCVSTVVIWAVGYHCEQQVGLPKAIGSGFEVLCCRGRITIDNRPQLAAERTLYVREMLQHLQRLRQKTNDAEKEYDRLRMGPTSQAVDRTQMLEACVRVSEAYQDFERLRFEWVQDRQTGDYPPNPSALIERSMPCRVPAAAFAFLPMLWIAHWFRPLNRKRLQLCTSCGYDLRASKNRCPECGTAFTSPDPASHSSAV